MIKKFPLYMLLCMMVGLAACSDDEDDKVDNGYTTYNVSVQLLYPEDSEVQASAGVSVSLSSTSGTAYDATTDADGKAVFQVPAGIYAASASEVRAMDGYSHVLNGTASGITVNESWNPDNTVSIEMVESVSGQVVIKELYVGGCQKDDGSGLYQFDKYVILYNNSAQTATLENLCFGMVNPYNANTSTNDYVNGELVYAADGYIPAGCGIWYAQQDITIEPGKQIVVAMNGAINHTPTYSNSVDLSNADYCMYDMEDFSVFGDVDSVPMRYVMLMEATLPEGLNPDTVAAELDKGVCEGNPSYGDKVAKGMLDHLRLLFLQPETYLLYRDVMISKGAASAQLKPPRILNEIQRRFFMALLEDDQ